MSKSNQRSGFKISIVVPIMNEAGNIAHLIEKLRNVLSKYEDYEIIFVDDGSTDETLSIIKDLKNKIPQINFLSFSRNFGHQNALKAGLDFAKGDCVISLDGDLQHPPELIPQMIDLWREGYDVVYTVRQDDPKLSMFKRFSSRLFYKFVSTVSDIDIEVGSADFRLLDKSVVSVIRNITEKDPFMRGIVRWLGFKQFSISYMPEERLWGTTKYTFKKMFQFAVTGVMSFSIKPLYFSIYFGFFMAAFSFCYALYALYIKIFTNSAIEGWTSIFILVSLLGGIQLITIGVLGKYLGMLFIEQKRRPTYIVREQSF